MLNERNTENRIKDVWKKKEEVIFESQNSPGKCVSVFFVFISHTEDLNTLI